MRLTVVASLAAALGMVACTSAPDNPTWRSDVKQIIEANCIKCHGRVARGGAPDSARFDRFELAGGFAGLIASRTSAKTMPPEIPLGDVEIETLQNWFDNGAPLGDPDPDNRLPEIQIDGFEGDDLTVNLEYLISDEDFDGVAGTMTATRPIGGPGIQITDDLHSGVGTVDWFIAAVPTGSYDVTAVLDDGQETRDVELGRFTVERADPNTAPTLSIQSPLRGRAIGAVDETLTFTIEDPDVGDTTDVVFTLTRGDDEVIVVTTVMNAPIGETTVVVDTSALPEGVNFTLVAEAGISSASVDQITVRH